MKDFSITIHLEKEATVLNVTYLLRLLAKDIEDKGLCDIEIEDKGSRIGMMLIHK